MRGPKAPRRGTELNQLSIIPDGSLLVRDGMLREVGPTRRVENLREARDAVEINAAGRVVMPGFVDSHTHLLFPPPGAPAGDLTAAARVLSATSGMQLKLRATRYLESMARHGTTTVEVKTGSGGEINRELKILRVLAEIRQDPIDVVATFLFRPPWLGGGGEDAFNADWKPVRAELFSKILQRRLSDFVDLAWDDFTESLWHGDPGRAAWVEGYFQAARSLGLRCKLHADSSSVARAAAAALQHHVASIDHIEHTREADVAVLSRSDSVATLLPGASFHGGDPYAPGRQLVDAGVAVALGTNFNAQETPLLNMQTAIALACREMRLTPGEAISAATINAAYALDRGGTAGSLECGKFADVVLLNVPDYRELAHCFGANLVHTVMKRGAVIYQEGEVGPRPAEELPTAW